MTETPTPLDLDPIRARANAATEGRWEVDGPYTPGPDDSPEAEAAAIRAARRGFTHPADTD